MVLLTVWLRFSMNMQSTRDTVWFSTLTFGYRVHHGYVGLLVLILVALLWGRWPFICRGLAALGIALVLSDLIHHFLILWPITGSPQFDLVYPRL